MSSILNLQRPGSSARSSRDKNAENENSRGRSSRIPKIPKRTYSNEDKESSNSSRESRSRYQNSSTSMIPRPEWKKSILGSREKKKRKSRIEAFKTHDENADLRVTDTWNLDVQESGIKNLSKSSTPRAVSADRSLENKISEDFVNFKKNVLRIPEYWTDAGNTVSSILKNAINIVSKQYPFADVEAFEMEIQNILKATETVKNQILTKTENIINEANKIYENSNEQGSSEELLKITNKLEKIRNEMNVRKNGIGDMLICNSEMKQLMEMEKALELKKETPKENYKTTKDHEKKEEKFFKQPDGKKLKLKNETQSEKNIMQSCGDVPRRDKKSLATGDGNKDETPPKVSSGNLEDKSSQTINYWTAELNKRGEDLNNLNNQILELHQLCKDHISKFKSFNLQIKLRGLCNKAQNLSNSREIQILNDEKIQLTEKNNELQYYNKDLESAIKQRDLDIHQKDRLISQQKKLLHVRDELIEMLKSRCNIQEVEQV